MAMSLEVLLPCRPAEVGFGGKQGIFAFSSDSWAKSNRAKRGACGCLSLVQEQ